MKTITVNGKNYRLTVVGSAELALVQKKITLDLVEKVLNKFENAVESTPVEEEFMVSDDETGVSFVISRDTKSNLTLFSVIGNSHFYVK